MQYTGMWYVLTPDAQYLMISLAQIFGTGLGMCLIFLPKLLSLNNDIKKVSPTNGSSTKDTPSGSGSGSRETTRSGSGRMINAVLSLDNEVDQLREENKKLKGSIVDLQTEIDSLVTITSTKSNGVRHATTARPHNDDDDDDDDDDGDNDNDAPSPSHKARQTGSFFFAAGAAEVVAIEEPWGVGGEDTEKSAEEDAKESKVVDRWAETKNSERRASADARFEGRRNGMLRVRRDSNIDSIEAVSNIVSMILAPMVIVPFLDYCALGKIPRSNTAKPGSSAHDVCARTTSFSLGDSPTAKMGSRHSISQPVGDGWTVIFVSVRLLCRCVTPCYYRILIL